MKLHLTKSLRAALIACVCVAASAYGTTISGTTELNSSAITENIDGTGDLTITGETNIGGVTINNTGTLTFDFSKAMQIGTWPGSAAPVKVEGNVTDVTISGAGATLTCHSSLKNGGSLMVAENATFTVANGTTVVLNDAIVNNGTLKLGWDSGALLTLSDAALATLTDTGTGAAGYTDGNNGFRATHRAYDIIDGSGTVQSVNQHGKDVTSYAVIGNQRFELAEDGTFSGFVANAAASTYYVNEGTVKDSDISGATAVEVASGATLYFSDKNENNAFAIKLNGGTMDMNQAFKDDGSFNGAGAYQVFSGTITLAGGASITGGEAHGLISEGGSIVATGTGNEISATISVRQDLTIDVTGAGDKLTISGTVQTNGNGTGANNTVKDLVKTGDGTLIIASTASIGSDIALHITDGTLDLSNVETLNVKAFELTAGTTVILGENTHINFTDALTIGEGVIFDLSGWCTYDGFDPYDLFTYKGSDEASVSLPTNVTIHTSTGDNDKAWLEFDAATGNVKLIPEPTTATLSLLALAGLAARRRRK